MVGRTDDDSRFDEVEDSLTVNNSERADNVAIFNLTGQKASPEILSKAALKHKRLVSSKLVGTIERLGDGRHDNKM